jgi:ATP-dependent DNA helicase PIF1
MRLVSELKSKGRKYAVTASTGISAISVRGRTIHSFAGIGIGDKPVKQLYTSMNANVRARVLSIDILILDEISMISAALFDKLNELFQLVRDNKSPFGGVQMIISGDFLQLAPFEKSRPSSSPSSSSSAAAAAVAASQRVEFAFESNAWRLCIPPNHVIQLNTVYRQSGDALFVRYCFSGQVSV